MSLTPAPIYFPMRTGGTFYYTVSGWHTGATTWVQSTEYAVPFYVQQPVTLGKIGVATTGVASSSVRLGIYNDSSGTPGTLVLDAGSVGTTGAGFVSITISQTMPRGWCWLACAVQGANGNTTTVSGQAYSGLVPATSPYTTGTVAGYSQTGITGALASPWGATLTLTNPCPAVWVAPA